MIGTLSSSPPTPGDLNATHLPEAPGGAAALLHGGPAEHGGAEQPHPGGHQGAVHGDPPGRRVALPQGGAQRLERSAAAATQVDRAGADRLRGRVPALRARGHPRLVDAARPGHPGRSARPAPPRAGGDPSRERGAAAARRSTSSRYRIDSRTAQIERAPDLGRRDRASSPSCGPRSRACSIISARSAPASASGSRRTGRASTRGVGTVYQRRRMFEESVTRIAEGISSYLDLEEQAAQAMFPHYFEKQKTDGVDYQIYVGASLLEDGRVDPLYLKNLRLWQLMVTCGIAVARRAAARPPPDPARDDAPDPGPARAAVDPVPVRREALRRRRRVRHPLRDHQEANRQGGGPGDDRARDPAGEGGASSTASPARRRSTAAYIEYLQNLGYLTGGVEELELEELQGVQGLRALRVQVALDNPKLQERINLADLHAAPGLRG